VGQLGQEGQRIVVEEVGRDLVAGVAERQQTSKAALGQARLALISSPGEVHRLAWKFSDVGRASKLAGALRRAKPSELVRDALGTLDARAFFDPEDRKWHIAARYLPVDSDDDGSSLPGKLIHR
jgi:hypothetical protein